MSMEAPRASEGAAGCWASPLVMANGPAFHPQPPGWRWGLLWTRSFLMDARVM